MRLLKNLQKVFGIQNFSPSIKVEKSIPALIIAVQAVMKEIYTGTESFKITAKRSDHDFEQTSEELKFNIR